MYINLEVNTSNYFECFTYRVEQRESPLFLQSSVLFEFLNGIVIFLKKSTHKHN